MTSDRDHTPSPNTDRRKSADERQKRLAEALRANLRRRKDQARQRDAAADKNSGTERDE